MDKQPVTTRCEVLEPHKFLRDGHVAFRTDSLDRARHHMSGVIVSHGLVSQERASPLDFWHRRADVGGISIHRVHYGPAVSLHVPPIERFYLLQITLSGGCTIGRGGRSFEVPAGHCAMVQTGSSYAKRWAEGTEQLMVLIDRAMLEQTLGHETGSEVRRPLTFDPVSRPLASIPALAGLVRVLCDECVSGGWESLAPGASKQVVGALMSLLIYALPHDRRGMLYTPAPAAAPRYVRAAEDFISCHATEDIGLHEMACAAGVSIRTLHMGFRRFRECTPIEHLRGVRLDRARRTLSTARSNGLTVTAVAEQSGLRHLGRFAQDYARRFGELPSETLARN